jgi:peptide/nickel transport system ATP-binding protein/oligopeptide transport system ATP-binding protein
VCRTDEPPLAELVPGHRVACHFPENAPTGS